LYTSTTFETVVSALTDVNHKSVLSHKSIGSNEISAIVGSGSSHHNHQPNQPSIGVNSNALAFGRRKFVTTFLLLFHCTNRVGVNGIQIRLLQSATTGVLFSHQLLFHVIFTILISVFKLLFNDVATILFHLSELESTANISAISSSAAMIVHQ
jgi:hypothetical protein